MACHRRGRLHRHARRLAFAWTGRHGHWRWQSQRLLRRLTQRSAPCRTTQVWEVQLFLFFLLRVVFEYGSLFQIRQFYFTQDISGVSIRCEFRSPVNRIFVLKMLFPFHIFSSKILGLIILLKHNDLYYQESQECLIHLCNRNIPLMSINKKSDWF